MKFTFQHIAFIESWSEAHVPVEQHQLNVGVVSTNEQTFLMKSNRIEGENDQHSKNEKNTFLGAQLQGRWLESIPLHTKIIVNNFTWGAYTFLYSRLLPVS